MIRVLMMFAVSLLLPLFGHAQFKSGIIVGVSDSWVKKGEIRETFDQSGEKDLKWNHRFSFNLGYQFQFDVLKKIDFNVALLYQGRSINVAFCELDGKEVEETKLLNSVQASCILRYKMWRGVRVGIGLEPTVYFNTSVIGNWENNKFDVPLVVSGGYDFKIFQVSVAYKNGFKQLYYNTLVSKTKTRDIQVSVFIPINYK
ncbi:outer membrane beta-barrel protein [Parabacteroides goldsteinii]|jgi:hypothetical protein